VIDEPTAEDVIDTPTERGRSRRNAAMLTAGVGIAFSVLFTVSLVLIAGVPSVRATNEELRDYYNSETITTAVVVGLYVMPFAGIAFIWFTVAMRMWATLSNQRLSFLHSNLQFVSGIAFVLLMFVASAAMSVVGVTVRLAEGPVDVEAARQFPVFGITLTLFFAMRMAAMFVFTTSAIGRSAGILPRWFVYIGFVVGAFLLLTTTFSPLLVVLFPGWVLVLCIILLAGARKIPKEERLPARYGTIGAMTAPPRLPPRDTEDAR
jgi:hypothetical protein